MPKLIESDLPFAELSLVAERESWRKEIYRPVYYLHKWWAKRLGSVFRGIVLGACIQNTEDFWERFYSCNDFSNTLLFDPFMGSGVTVGEAIKLGCKTIGQDVNPVAWLACRASFSSYSIADVFSVYDSLKSTVAPHLQQYFKTTTSAGDNATVLYFFLVKVLPCPNCNHNVELFKTRIFSRHAVPSKDPTARSICPECGAINVTVYNAESVTCPQCSFSYNPQRGNIKGATAKCNYCGTSFRLAERMKSLDGPLNYRRYAKLVLTSDGKKLYEPLNEVDRNLERHVAEEYSKIIDTFPLVPIAPGYNTNQMLKHNYRYWHELLSDRQLVCAKHLINATKNIQQEDLRVLFACLFSGVLEFNNLFTSFKGEGTGAVRHMFAHHVLKPEAMPLEANMWGTSKSSGAFSCLFKSRVERALSYKSDPFELKVNGTKSTKVRGINHPVSRPITSDFSEFMSKPNTVYLGVDDSSATEIPDNSVDVVVTDPPFFDNVHYSELADFFYYWLNQIVEMSDRNTTRSPGEVQDIEWQSFTNKLTDVFTECQRVLRPHGLFIFTYHHSRHEGWTAVHRAIRYAGFTCVQSYPIKAEVSVSVPLHQAKSPIHLDLIVVCKQEQMKEQQLNSEDAIEKAISVTKGQISSLRSVGIQVSLGDAKVALMGRFLCEIHRLQNIRDEEQFLAEIENDIDSYVSSVLNSQGEVLYEQAPKTEQLTLFEEMGNYLSGK